MNIEDIPKSKRHTYENTCECGKTYFILAQQDNDPEYYAEIYVECDCGQYVDFDIPVN